MRAWILVAACLLWAPTIRAQSPDCRPIVIESAQGGEAGQAMVPALSDPDHFVPTGEVWKIRAAGIATDDGHPLEWMLQIDHQVVSQDHACCWLIPLMRLTGTTAATPVLALHREILLTAGERLSARVNGLDATKHMSLLYVGWKFPAACTAALVLGSP